MRFGSLIPLLLIAGIPACSGAPDWGGAPGEGLIDDNPGDYGGATRQAGANGEPLIVELRERQFIPAMAGDRFETELDSFYRFVERELDLAKTALVLLDVWDEPQLDALVEDRIAPLLRMARGEGMTVIHAPSIHGPHPAAEPLPGKTVVWGFDTFDRELESRGIDTLLYAGYDAFLCMLDKPCGMIQAKWRNPELRVILIRDCAASAIAVGGQLQLNGLKRDVAVNLVEKEFGSTTTLADLSVALGHPAEDAAYAAMRRALDDFRSSDIDQLAQKLNENTVDAGDALAAGSAALVVVGASDDHPNDGYLQRLRANRVERLVPLLAWAREAGLGVIHVPNEHGTSPDCAPRAGEAVARSYDEFLNAIERDGYKTLLYAGYAINEDMLHGPAGLVRMYSRARHEKRAVPEIFVASDATIAFEAPFTVGNELARQASALYRDFKLVSAQRLIRAR